MQTILVAPTLTAQVRDLIYTVGLQTQPMTSTPTTVNRQSPGRAIGTLYTNTGKQAMFVYASLVTATAPTT